MLESNTFSACVDDVIGRSGQPGRLNDIISYIRQTMRELQVLGFFYQDRVEDQITTTSSPHIWDTPKNFRQWENVRYPLYDPRGYPIYPKVKNPGRGQSPETYYYYGSGTSYVFAGLDIGLVIDISYFAYFRPLPYYTEDNRPARFDIETEAWTYLAATTDSEKEAARNLVTNWLLSNWYDVVLEGGLAKLYKTVKDDRAISSFALYKSLQNSLLAGEPHASRGSNTNV